MKIKTGSILLLLLIASSFIIFNLLPKKSFWIRDCGNKFILINEYNKNVENKNIISYPGISIDNDLNFFPIPPPFARKVNGKIISQYPFSFFLQISAKLFKIFDFFGLYILSFISFLFTTLILSMNSISKQTNKHKLFLVLIFFGSPLLFYSMTFWEHTFAVFLSYMGILYYNKKTTILYTLISAILLASSVLIREELLFLVAAIIINSLISNSKIKFKRNIIFLLFFTLIIAISGDFTIRINHYTNNIVYHADLLGYISNKISVINNLLLSNHPSYLKSNLRAIGILIIALLLFFKNKLNKNYLIFFYSIIIVSYILDLLMVKDLSNFLLKGNGLFLTFPLSILMFIKNHSTKKYQRIIFIFFVLVATFCPLASSYGVHWSARMLLGVIPIFFLITNEIIITKVISKKIINLLFILSILLQIISVIFLFDRKLQTKKLITAVKSYKDLPIITTVPWLAEDLAPLYHKKKIFFLKSPQMVDQLKELLIKKNEPLVLFISYGNSKNSNSLIIESPLKRFKSFNLEISKYLIKHQ